MEVPRLALGQGGAEGAHKRSPAPPGTAGGEAHVSPFRGMGLSSPGAVTCAHATATTCSPAFSAASGATVGVVPSLAIGMGSSCSTCRSELLSERQSPAGAPTVPASQLLRAYSPALQQAGAAAASLLHAAGLHEASDDDDDDDGNSSGAGSRGHDDDEDDDDGDLSDPSDSRAGRPSGGPTLPPFMTGAAYASTGAPRAGADADGSEAGSSPGGSRKSSTGAGGLEAVGSLAAGLPPPSRTQLSFQERLGELLKARGAAASFDSEFHATRDSWSLSWREAADRQPSIRFPRLSSSDEAGGRGVTMAALLQPAAGGGGGPGVGTGGLSSRSVHSTPRFAPALSSQSSAGGEGVAHGSPPLAALTLPTASARGLPPLSGGGQRGFFLAVGSSSSTGGGDGGAATSAGGLLGSSSSSSSAGGSNSGSDSLTPSYWPPGASISPAPPSRLLGLPAGGRGSGGFSSAAPADAGAGAGRAVGFAFAAREPRDGDGVLAAGNSDA